MVVQCGASIGDVDPVGAVGPYVEPTSVDFDHLVDGVGAGDRPAPTTLAVVDFRLGLLGRGLTGLGCLGEDRRGRVHCPLTW
jgi:hypothetical protein